MKRNAFLLIFLVFTRIPVMAQETAPEKLFYQAVYAEQVDGNLTKARALYEQILQSKPDDRILMAKTLYRLGLIGEKEGAQKALGYYTRVIEQFPEQKDIIELVQTRVDKLDNANTFIDPRDGHKYKWVKIGNQIWMAENLAYMPWVNPPKKQEYGIWVYDYEGEDVAEAKATENYQKYGCLYDWATAMDIDPKYLEEPWEVDTKNHRGLCPPGWRIPKRDDWIELEQFLGMPDSLLKEKYYRGGHIKHGIVDNTYPPIGRHLKSSTSWMSDGDGDDKSAFNALPGGIRKQSKSNLFELHGYNAYFWTADIANSTEAADGESFGESAAWTRQLFGKGTTIVNVDDIWSETTSRTNGQSVRCIKADYVSNEPYFIVENRKKYDKKPIIVPSPESQHATSPKILWTKNLSAEILTLAAGNGRVFFECKDSALYAFDVDQGSEIWKLSHYNGFTLNPMIYENGNLFLVDEQGLKAINTDNGQIVWLFESKKDYGYLSNSKDYLIYSLWRPVNSPKSILAINKKNGLEIWKKEMAQPYLTTWPAINDNQIIVATAKSSGQDVYCSGLDKNSREELWKFKVRESIKGSPVSTNEITVFGSNDNYLYAVDNKTGKEKWRFFCGKSLFGQVSIDENIIFALGLNHCYALNIETGDILWEMPVDGSVNSSMASEHLGQFVFIAPDGKSVYSVNAKSGKIEWRFQTSSMVSANPVIYNNTVFIGTRDGELFALEIPHL